MTSPAGRDFSTWCRPASFKEAGTRTRAGPKNSGKQANLEISPCARVNLLSHMRRFLVILFFAITGFQLALAGVPGFAASSSNQAMLMTPAPVSALTPCGSHSGQDDILKAQPCEPSQPCENCTLCQACHPTALAETPWIWAPPLTSTRSPGVFNTAFLSAERAPGFKPPIL